MLSALTSLFPGRLRLIPKLGIARRECYGAEKHHGFGIG